MLSYTEKRNLKDILTFMSEEDLKMMAKSITENILVPLSKEGKLMSENILK